MLRIAVIVGSTREGRFSELLLPWVQETAERFENIELDIIDLKTEALPLLHSSASPATVNNGDYGDDAINRYAQKIAAADGFLVLTPEYNHGYSAVLKNAFDVISAEWRHKAIAFVAYGSLGGVRAVEQLRQLVPEFHMATPRAATHILAPWNLRTEAGDLKEGALTEYTPALENTLKELVWWSDLLQAARTGE